MIKKLSILFLFFTLILAKSQTFSVDGINYNVLAGTNNVEVAANNCYTGDLIISSTISDGNNNYTLTSIGDNAFINCTALKSVIIPNSVTSIGNHAFDRCYLLQSVTIPNSVTFIGDYAFFGCLPLTSVTIPNTLTSIGNATFADTGLISVTIPNSVTSIGEDAFYSCTNLSSITIPNSVTFIGQGTFTFCSNLVSLTFPNSVTSIEDSIFFACTSLKSVTIPNSVTTIGNDSFNGCKGLVSITIPNSVLSIGDEAFQDCSGLTSIKIPNSVTSVGYGAFNKCTHLTSIIIPNSVTFIGDYAFSNCTSLTSVICCDVTAPLVINADVFQNVNQALCSLSVPPESVSLYRSADVWKNFNPITACSLSTNENNSEKNIFIYPNPIHNEVVVEMKNSANSKLEVYDTNGKVVLRKSLNNSKNTINTNGLPAGIYLFKVGNSVTKVIKN